MHRISVEDDPSPEPLSESQLRESFISLCSQLERQCDSNEQHNSLWQGVDIPDIHIDDLPRILGSEDELYTGDFLSFCQEVVSHPKYQRFGDRDGNFNIRIKIVATDGQMDSLTILLQQEYIGYDISLQGEGIVRRRTGQKPEILHEGSGELVLDDISHVIRGLISYAYQTQADSAKMVSCDLPVQSMMSKESVSKPRRNLARRALRLLKI